MSLERYTRCIPSCIQNVIVIIRVQRSLISRKRAGLVPSADATHVLAAFLLFFTTDASRTVDGMLSGLGQVGCQRAT